MSTKYRLTDGMWIRNQFTREQFCIDASNNEYVAGNVDGRQILCRRDCAIRIHPPIQKTTPTTNRITLENLQRWTWTPADVNPVTYTTTYDVSTASS
jgi:hypothetical protein